jgi:type IV fimbrial biogenesis protein FimT
MGRVYARASGQQCKTARIQRFLRVATGPRRGSIVVMRTRGFTLLELCVALGLVAVLATLAIPSFRSHLRTAAVRTATYELLAGLQQARGAAIVESRAGVLCLAEAAGDCRASGGPAPAWRVFLESDPGHPFALRVLPRDVTVRGTRARIRFSARALAASAATLTVCDAQGVAAPRAIGVSRTARARLDTAAAADCRE